MGGGRTLELVVDENFPKEVSAAAGIEVVRVVQEALVNVRRHSGARRATVSLGVADDEIRVEIEDDGQGFGPETSPGSDSRGCMSASTASAGNWSGKRGGRGDAGEPPGNASPP
jgi:signal transduction histidine kinase